MRLLSKPILTVLITIVVIVGGFIFLIRGCLSSYDEQSAIAPALYFEKDGKTIVFAIVQHEKATSYSRKGNFVQKSVSTTYYIQTNDVSTAARISDKKIKHHSDIKHYPIEVLGSSGNAAWIFMGELMAFDPFTLDKIADIKILEQKNPGLAGKFPDDKQYYSFDPNDKQVYFTANDGIKWKLDPKTLIASERGDDSEGSPAKNMQSISRSIEEHERGLNNLRRTSQSYTATMVNQDTVNGMWFGLYSPNEMSKLNNRFQSRGENDETARRGLYASTCAFSEKYNDWIIELDLAKLTEPRNYLHGGLLLDKRTAKPIHLTNPGGFLIISKEKIGREGKIIITRVTYDGNTGWTFPTGLPQWVDWMVTDKYLMLLGTDNKELSSNNVNLLICIDLATGKTNTFDYFVDKRR